MQSAYKQEHFDDPRYFGEIKVDEVALTTKGRKLFSEGAIPTGEEGYKSADIFFSPVTRRFDVQYTLKYSPLSNCFLGEEFLDNVDMDISGLEDYLNANRTNVGLKEEERIAYFETEKPQKMNVRTEDNITLNIYPTHIEFTFASPAEKKFFDKYYSSAIIRQGMIMKDKFEFPLECGIPTVNISDIHNLAALYLPNELVKQAKHPCIIFLHRGNVEIDRNDVICADKQLSCKLLNIIDKNAEFALLDKSGCKYYCALDLNMPCKNFGDMFALPLLTESTLQSEPFREIVERLYMEYAGKPFDDEVGKVVTYAVDSLGRSEYFGQLINKKLYDKENVDERIDILLKLNSELRRHAAWKKYFVESALKLYHESISEVKIDNIIYKNTVLKPLKEALQISNMDYVHSFSNNICKMESSEIVYEALDSVGFTDTEILSVVNVAEIFMRAVLERETIVSETALASKYKTVQTNLWKLNDMLGIESSAEYTLRDDYNTDEFFNAYGTLQNAVKAIDKYKKFAPKEYELFGRYIAILGFSIFFELF